MITCRDPCFGWHVNTRQNNPPRLKSQTHFLAFMGSDALAALPKQVLSSAGDESERRSGLM
jgi:hypothetical protein